MATIPTQNAVPSEAPRDLKFNSGKIDEFVTSLEHEYKDRFGRTHLTIEGIKWMFDQLVERFKVDMNQAIIAAGYIPMDSFQQGAEITKRNEILRDETTGEYYRWDGDLPKSVQAGSTPESAGGVGVGAWVSVGDANLKAELSGETGLSNIGGCESIFDLRLVMGKNNGDHIFLKSYHPGKNKGGDIFRWDSSSIINDDGGCIIKPHNIEVGRWVRAYHDRYTPEMYGADGTKENDPDAIERLLIAQKRILFIGTYFYNREFVTNGHDIEGAAPLEIFGGSLNSKIVFFGGFNSEQAVRNELRRSTYRNITFEPESWNESTGYGGSGMRLHRNIHAECCGWFKFKKYGMDLWEDSTTSPILAPYSSQFINCRWEMNGLSGIRLAQGANAIQIYGGASAFNGATAYGVKPEKGDPQVGDGIIIGHFSDVPKPSYPLALQGVVIDGIDCSYNSRNGVNMLYCNQSKITIGYSEWNLSGKEVNIEDVVACDINILVAADSFTINVPSKPGSEYRSATSLPNHIFVNGRNYGTGIKDSYGRYMNATNIRFGYSAFSSGSEGSSGFRAYKDNSGATESYGQMLVRAGSGDRPASSEKYLGTLWRDTSIYPNIVYMCIENSPGIYGWSKIN